MSDLETGSVVKIGEQLLVLRSLIRPFLNQPRTFFDPEKLSELAASIKEHGQFTPAPVIRVNNDSKYQFELIDGQRRWHAIKIAKLTHMKVVVAKDEELMTEFNQFVASVISNFGSVGHTPMEIAKAIKRCQKEGLTIEKITKIFVKSISWVVQHLSLLKLCSEVQDMMSPELPKEERLSFSVAVEIASLPENHQLRLAKIIILREMKLYAARSFIQSEIDRLGFKTKRRTREKRPDDYFRNLKSLVGRTQGSLNLFTEKPQDFFNLLFQNRSEEDPVYLISNIQHVKESLSVLSEKVKNALENKKK